MKLKLALPFSILLLFAAVALFTGSRLFWLLAILVALICAGGILGVLWASSSLSVEGELTEDTVQRGEDLTLSIRLRHRGLIPVAPLLLEIGDPSVFQGREIRLRNQPHRLQSLRLPIHAAHVGVMQTGLRSVTVEDLLGIASRRVVLPETSFELLVLPRTFSTDPLTLAPGDPGSEIMARATEDLNAPSDVRSYQPGDAMKKIHWKLSLRKGELIVRRFDEPVLQDVLILLDCSRPPALGAARAEADLRDALLETAASYLRDQTTAEHQFRLPLAGSHPVEVDSSMTAGEIDHMTRKIQHNVYRKCNVIITAVGIYSFNTDDPEVNEMREKIYRIIKARKDVLQVHGFYADKSSKIISVDYITDFDADDPKRDYQEIFDEIQALYPDYEIRLTLDLDISD